MTKNVLHLICWTINEIQREWRHTEYEVGRNHVNVIFGTQINQSVMFVRIDFCLWPHSSDYQIQTRTKHRHKIDGCSSKYRNIDSVADSLEIKIKPLESYFSFENGNSHFCALSNDFNATMLIGRAFESLSIWLRFRKDSSKWQCQGPMIQPLYSQQFGSVCCGVSKKSSKILCDDELFECWIGATKQVRCVTAINWDAPISS